MAEYETTGSGLTAYLDESFDDRLYVISGFVARPEKWANFSPAWASELKRPPRIQRFKMNEVQGTNRGNFKTFTPQQREAKLLGLAGVINQYAEWDCSATLDYGAYKQILEPLLPPRFRDPYLWTFHGILTAICSYELHVGQRRAIDFVFDEKRRYFAQAVRLFDQVQSLPPFNEVSKCIKTVREGKDEFDLPLQAADMMAGQVRLFFAAPPPRSMSPGLASLKRAKRSSYNHALTTETMIKIAETIKAAKL
jgi:hypothetical protein